MIQFEPVNCCPACGGKGEFIIAGGDKDYPEIVIRVDCCTRCGTSYHNPRMTQAAMVEYYSSGKYREQERRKITEALSMRRIAAALMYIDLYSRVIPKRCLDVGCSRGYLSREIHKKYGADAIGYDVYQDPAAVIDIITSKEQITGKFDLITCIHVLEHYAEPLAELDWMAGLLGENGMLMVEIPTARVVTLPHPVIFSRDAVPRMMRHIGAEYIWLDLQIINTGFIFAWRLNNNGTNK